MPKGSVAAGAEFATGLDDRNVLVGAAIAAAVVGAAGYGPLRRRTAGRV